MNFNSYSFRPPSEPPMRRRPGFFAGMPLLFKLWFGFIAAIIIAVFGFYGYLAYNVVTLVQGSTPEDMGRLLGSVVRGFNEAAR